MQLLAREAAWRVHRRIGWDLLIDRNRWFQRHAVEVVRGLREKSEGPTVVFAHSYSALGVFKYAKSRGWTTVLGQIDPGEEHYRIVRRLGDEWPEYGEPPAAPPPAYFQAWREECELADWIVVNSEWGREALERDGIPGRKLRVIPLAYEPEAGLGGYQREYPAAFTAVRPLRVLFVGHGAVAKGLPALLGAVERLDDLPLQLSVVGQASAQTPSRFLDHRAISWLGQVPRSKVMDHCREADVLVFPSLSDGFGMVQAEAQALGLPVIASRFCGQVVQDGVNGILLPEVTPRAIAAALRQVASQPGLLAEFARHANVQRGTGVAGLGFDLLALEPAMCANA